MKYLTNDMSNLVCSICFIEYINVVGLSFIICLHYEDNKYS